MILILRLLPVMLLGACALKPPAPPAPQFIVPPGTEFVSDLFGYSQAVRVGPWVTVSAVPGFDIEKRGFPEVYEDQVAAAFANLKLVLEAAGAHMSDVVEITTYQLDMEKFNATVDGKNEAFGEHRPTWTAVGAAGLPLPSMQFQVSARAFSPLAPGPAGSAPPPAKATPADTNADAPARFNSRPGY